MGSPQYELADFAKDVGSQEQAILGPPASGIGHGDHFREGMGRMASRPVGVIYGHLVEERPLDKSSWIKPDPEVIRRAKELGILGDDPVDVTISAEARPE